MHCHGAGVAQHAAGTFSTNAKYNWLPSVTESQRLFENLGVTTTGQPAAKAEAVAPLA
jgi:hypothetical protein